VPAQSKTRGHEPSQGVAILAAIEVRRGGELPFVLIAVAVRTVPKLYLEDGVFALRKMALPTL